MTNEVFIGENQFYSPELFVRDPLQMKLYKVALRCGRYYAAGSVFNYHIQKWSDDKDEWEPGECDFRKASVAIKVSEDDLEDHRFDIVDYDCKYIKDTIPVADYPVTTLYQDVLDYDPALFVIECQGKEHTVSIFTGSRLVVFQEEERGGAPCDVSPVRDS